MCCEEGKVSFAAVVRTAVVRRAERDAAVSGTYVGRLAVGSLTRER